MDGKKNPVLIFFLKKKTHKKKKKLLFGEIYKLFILIHMDGIFLPLWEK